MPGSYRADQAGWLRAWCLDELADMAWATSRGRRLVVLVDGRSGAGKSTLAAGLAARLGDDVQLVRLDDCYQGWHGLAAAARTVPKHLLHPREPGYRAWDWDNDQPAEWVPLDPRRPLVIEGSGALTAASAALASLTVWVDADEATRLRLVRQREGTEDIAWWQMWADQERSHMRTDRPARMADVIVNPVKGVTWMSRPLASCAGWSATARSCAGSLPG